MAEEFQNPLGPQPDFPVISQCFQTLADQMARVPNTPQFDTGNAILAQLQQMSQQINTVSQQLNTRLDAVSQQLNAVDTRIEASDNNNAARISNSLLLNATDALTPLHNPRDNTLITGFPTTSANIRGMTADSLNTVLEELGLSTRGLKPAREKRLRQYIGLKTDPA